MADAEAAGGRTVAWLNVRALALALALVLTVQVWLLLAPSPPGVDAVGTETRKTGELDHIELSDATTSSSR